MMTIELALFGKFATNPHLPRGLDISGVVESDTSMTKSSSALILDITKGRLVAK
jgi:hypothetical protein